jgi:hypothetical protein
MTAFVSECADRAMDRVTRSAFVNETVKLAGVSPGQVKSFLSAHKGALKNIGIGTGAVGAYLAGKQAKDDYVLGRRMRKQYESRGG